MVTDVSVVTTTEDHIHRFEPWRGEHLPRVGESVWADGARWRVAHVVHAPLDADVTLFVDPEPNSHDPPRALAEGKQAMTDGGESNPTGEDGDGDELPVVDREVWDCPRCPWRGRQADIDPQRWEVTCPECNQVIDEQLARLLEQESDWSREDGEPEPDGDNRCVECGSDE